MANETAVKQKRQRKSSMDLALAHKKDGAITNMSVVLNREERESGFGEVISRELDDDWNYLEGQRKAKELYDSYMTSDIRERTVYKGAEVDVDQSGVVVADAIELFDGAAVELTGATAQKKAEPSETMENRIEGKGGTLVLAPDETDNIVIVPILKFSVSEDGFEAEAKKQPGQGKTMPGFEQIQEIVFHGKEGMRLIAAQLLQIEDNQVILKDIKEYNYPTMSWCDTDDMTLSESGFSRKENVADTPAGRAQFEEAIEKLVDELNVQEEDESEEAQQSNEEGLKLTPIQSKSSEVLSAVSEKVKELLEDDEYETSVKKDAGSEEEGASLAEIISDIRENGLKATVEGAVEDKVEEVKEEIKEKIEDTKTRMDMAKDAFLMYKDGMSYEDIEKALEERGLQEVKQEKGLHFDADIFETYFPLLPFLQAYVSFAFEADMKHSFQKPSFAELGLFGDSNKHLIKAGAEVNAESELGLSTGVSLGVPVLIELQGGLNGALKLGGKGEKSTVLAGTLELELGTEKTEAGDTKLYFVRKPTLTLSGSLELSGELNVGVAAKSKIFGWDKDLYVRELGEWNLAAFNGELVLEKQDDNMKSPLSNWLTKSSRSNVSVFGNTISEHVSKSGMEECKKKSTLIADSTVERKENYDKLLEHLRLFKESQKENPVIVSKGAEGFKAMAGQAESLEEQFREAAEEAAAELNDAIWTVETYRASNEYIVGRKMNRESIEKHKKRQAALKNAGTEKERKAVAGIGYGRYLEETAEMAVLFQNAEAWKFYQQKFNEASDKKGKGGKLLLPLLQEKYVKMKQKDERFGTKKNEEFAKFYLDKLGSQQEAVRSYATPEDIKYYEQERSDKKKRAFEGKIKRKSVQKQQEFYAERAKELTLQGNLFWITNLGDGINRVVAAEKQVRNNFTQSTAKEWDKLQKITKEEIFTKGSAEEAILALSNSQMTLLLERYFAATGKGNLVKEWKSLAELELTADAAGGEMTRAKMMSRVLTVDMLLDYERRSKERETEDEEKRRKHDFRIKRLENRKKIMAEQRNRNKTPEERAVLEQNAVMEYFDGYETKRGLLSSSEGIKKLLWSGKLQTIFANPALQKQFEENLLKEYRELFTEYRMPTDKFETENKTLSAAERVAFVNNLSKDELGRMEAELAQMKAAGMLTAEGLDLPQYREAKMVQQDSEGSMEKYERLLLASKECGGNKTEFLKRYTEIYTMQHVADVLLKNISFDNIGQTEVENLYMFDEEWQKHNDRITMLEALSKNPIERHKYVEQYLQELSSGSNNFITFFYEGVLPSRLTPDIIMGYETAGREEEEEHYKGVLKLLQPIMGDGKLAADIDEEKKKSIYEELTNKDTGYFGEHKKQKEAILKQWEKASGAAGMYSAERMGSYEQSRIDFYQKKMDELNQPVREIQDAVAELTRQIADATNRILELESMIQNPKAFFAEEGLSENNPLVRAGELSETMWNDPKPAVKTEELLRKVQLA